MKLLIVQLSPFSCAYIYNNKKMCGRIFKCVKICEPSNDPSGSITSGELFDQLNDGLRLKKCAACASLGSR
jgi:hypothetical protein